MIKLGRLLKIIIMASVAILIIGFAILAKWWASLGLVVISLLGMLSRGWNYFERWLKYVLICGLLIGFSALILIYLGTFLPAPVTVAIIIVSLFAIFFIAGSIVHRFFFGKGGRLYKGDKKQNNS